MPVPKYRIALVGDCGSGKTAYIKRLLFGECVPTTSTLSTGTITYEIKMENISFEVLDYPETTKILGKVDAVILVIETTKTKHEKEASQKRWCSLVQKSAPRAIVYIAHIASEWAPFTVLARYLTGISSFKLVGRGVRGRIVSE